MDGSLNSSSVMIKIYHSRTRPVVIKSSSSDASDDQTPLLPPEQNGKRTRSSKKHVQHTPAFDRAIAQVSMALEVVCFALVPPLGTQWSFIVFTVLASCGAGYGPAIQSLALEVYARRGGTETGRLFGVLGVVQITS